MQQLSRAYLYSWVRGMTDSLVGWLTRESIAVNTLFCTPYCFSPHSPILYPLFCTLNHHLKAQNWFRAQSSKTLTRRMFWWRKYAGKTLSMYRHTRVCAHMPLSMCTHTSSMCMHAPCMRTHVGFQIHIRKVFEHKTV